MQRRGVGHRLEVMVKRRNTHIHLPRQLLNVEAVGILVLDASQRLGDLAKVGMPIDQFLQRRSAAATQHVVQNFAHNLRPQYPCIERFGHHVQQAFGGAQQLFRQLGQINPAAFSARFHQVVVIADVDQQVLQHLAVDIHRQPHQRQFRAGKGFTFERQRYRHQQIVTRIVLKHPIAAVTHFVALENDHHPRFVHHRLTRTMAIHIEDFHQWHRRRGITVTLGKAGRLARHPAAQFIDFTHGNTLLH
ncbi:hypothetical protein D3C78_1050600 [compost metagenome]